MYPGNREPDLTRFGFPLIGTLPNSIFYRFSVMSCNHNLVVNHHWSLPMSRPSGSKSQLWLNMARAKKTLKKMKKWISTSNLKLQFTKDEGKKSENKLLTHDFNGEGTSDCSESREGVRKSRSILKWWNKGMDEKDCNSSVVLSKSGSVSNLVGKDLESTKVSSINVAATKDSISTAGLNVDSCKDSKFMIEERAIELNDIDKIDGQSSDLDGSQSCYTAKTTLTRNSTIKPNSVQDDESHHESLISNVDEEKIKSLMTTGSFDLNLGADSVWESIQVSTKSVEPSCEKNNNDYAKSEDSEELDLQLPFDNAFEAYTMHMDTIFEIEDVQDNKNEYLQHQKLESISTIERPPKLISTNLFDLKKEWSYWQDVESLMEKLVNKYGSQNILKAITSCWQNGFLKQRKYLIINF